MTTYEYEPDCLTLPDMQYAMSSSSDPIRQVGAVLRLADGRIFRGANRVWGVPPEGVEWTDRPYVRAIIRHAEIDALVDAALGGAKNKDLQGSTMYVSLQPCEQCCAVLEHVGVEHVIFGEHYTPSDFRVPEVAETSESDPHDTEDKQYYGP
jgi:tRNA(Arg) A34 adenosine deaminase TadA